MLNRITKTASLLITLTVLTSGGTATAESENVVGSCNKKLLSSQINSHIALSPNGDRAHCSDYYQKCDEYHCYECTVCDYGGPYCWEISQSGRTPLNFNTFIANK